MNGAMLVGAWALPAAAHSDTERVGVAVIIGLTVATIASLADRANRPDWKALARQFPAPAPRGEDVPTIRFDGVTLGIELATLPRCRWYHCRLSLEREGIRLRPDTSEDPALAALIPWSAIEQIAICHRPVGRRYRDITGARLAGGGGEILMDEPVASAVRVQARRFRERGADAAAVGARQGLPTGVPAQGAVQPSPPSSPFRWGPRELSAGARELISWATLAVMFTLGLLTSRNGPFAHRHYGVLTMAALVCLVVGVAARRRRPPRRVS